MRLAGLRKSSTARVIRHILLLTDAYPPEIRSSSMLMHEMAMDLVAHGYEVSVVTTFPRYNLTDEARATFKRFSGNLVRDEEGVRVIRVPCLSFHNVGPMVKGLGQLALPAVVTAGSFFLRRVDAIVVYSPPLTLGLAATAVKKWFGARFILNVQDLFPQNAIDLGALRNPALIRMFQGIESFCYRHADHITCHSEGNLHWLLCGQDMQHRQRDVSVVHNWVDVDRYQRTPPDVTVRKRLGMEEKFVLFFGGVMGYAQDLETVMEAARLLKDHPEIAFLLVGDGVEKERLVRQAQGLPNVIFHPFIPQEEYISWLRAMNVGLVTLKAEMATPVVPSKILGFMAAGIPYLALLNRESDARVITEEAGCGLLIDPGNPKAAAQAILHLAEDRQATASMGVRGVRYCRDHFSRRACIDKYLEIFQSLEHIEHVKEPQPETTSAYRRHG